MIETECRSILQKLNLLVAGRKISECIALAKAYENKLCYAPVPDLDLAVT